MKRGLCPLFPKNFEKRLPYMAKSSSRKTSSPKLAKKASKVLQSKSSSKTAKSLAGSVLAQAKAK